MYAIYTLMWKMHTAINKLGNNDTLQLHSHKKQKIYNENGTRDKNIPKRKSWDENEKSFNFQCYGKIYLHIRIF